jgi:MoaA/NifB/PqqE/SkfB family radical SAM enzyme
MDQSDLSFERFVETLSRFPELERLELHGEGEPLMHPRIFDMAKLASSRGIKVSSISNGSHFTAEHIAAILDSGLEHLFVSIESADEEEFRDIRGGKLTKVAEGIRALLAARNARPQRIPAIGFAVTVLKRTRDALPKIVDLYKELGMDGGVSLHMLNSMPAYTGSYRRGMETQLLGKLDQALAWSRYARTVEREAVTGGSVHFSDQIFGQMGEAGPAKNRRAREYRSCSWLDHGLYVNRHGQASGCARIKDTQAFGFGAVAHAPAESILSKRDRMAEQLRSGDVPEACKGCFIADSIAVRIANLLDRRLVRGRGDADPHALEVIGDIPRDGALEGMLKDACDGRLTVREIVESLSAQIATNPDEGRRRLLPLVGQLVRERALVVAE